MNEAKQEFTLLQALKRYSEPEAWREYEPFERFYSQVFFVGGRPTYDESMTDRARTLRRRLEAGVIAKLADGNLIGTAYVEPMEIDSERIVIPRDKWRLLRVSFDY